MKPYVLRNWTAIVTFGLLAALSALLAMVIHPVVVIMTAFALTMMAINIRKTVFIEPAGVVLCTGLKTHRLMWQDITHMEVFYIRVPHRAGWQIRIHTPCGYRDTFNFMPFIRGASGVRFDWPPPEAPRPIHQLYAVLSANVTSTRGSPSS